MNSENLGARIAENGGRDKKIRAYEDLGARWSFHEVLGAFLEFSEWLEGLGAKNTGASAKFGIF
jgi:hypothetical protein